MYQHRTLLLCAVLALSTVLLSFDSKNVTSVPDSSASGTANERGMPALFAWGDVDGDGRLDLVAVAADGTVKLLVNAGDGHFEDVTERVGLFDVQNAALGLWADYDGDGQLDLFVGARDGASQLFHNEGGVFIDTSARSGLSSKGAVQSAQWLDHDGDGRLDLFVVTAEKSELFRGLQGGFFKGTELPFAVPLNGSAPGGFLVGVDRPTAPPAPGSPSDLGGNRSGGSIGVIIAPGPVTQGHGGAIPLASIPVGCAESIRDQATPTSCVSASTTPTLGMLYPISSNLFVATGGNVGIGTTSPAAKLDVAGTARMTGTLTLNPVVDQALDVSTGSIYKAGALFIHTKGGTGNTALGEEALASVTTGYRNTAIGDRALFSHTTGDNNTATGFRALYSNTAGADNTASGYRALYSNTTGFNNTATGVGALSSNTTGYVNTANGDRALYVNTTGHHNTASGATALSNNTTGFLNTAHGFRALYSNTTGSRNTANGVFALYANTTGIRNTASGYRALVSNTIGQLNTASGYRALFSNTNGLNNTASGGHALYSNTGGGGNTASGRQALFSNSTGQDNTATGLTALYGNTTGIRNTATGFRALRSNTIGSRNIALGSQAGDNLTTGSDNIAIGNLGIAGDGATIRLGTSGTHTRTFIAGIRGATTGFADAIPVVVDSAGQLGTISSSRRFKNDIRDMGDATARLLELRPVVFRYKQEQTMPGASDVALEYGLIAEEVAEIFPDLVVYDEGGKPFTVKYHLLSSMLLNEMKTLAARFEAQSDRLRELEARFAAIESRLPIAPPLTTISADSR